MKTNRIVLMVSGSLALIISIMLSRSHTLLTVWTVEDGPMEYLSALFWLTGAVMCFRFFWCTRGSLKWIYIVLTLFYFVCFGEEISWGQRIFGFNVQSVESKSHQEEFNLHNLEFFSKDSFYDQMQEGRFNPVLLFNTQNLFRLGFLALYGFFPVLLWIGRPKKWRMQIKETPPFPTYLIAAWSVHFYIWIVRFLMESEYREYMNEVEELWSAWFAMLFVWVILRPIPAKHTNESR
ncbi:hypothetical protein JW835_00210 [bacterium]|nr:hypothetical protein [bacterium]